VAPRIVIAAAVLTTAMIKDLVAGVAFEGELDAATD